jgi:hypothetical protein
MQTVESVPSPEAPTFDLPTLEQSGHLDARGENLPAENPYAPPRT